MTLSSNLYNDWRIYSQHTFFGYHVEPSQTPLTNCSVLPRVLPWDSAARGRASSAFTLGVGIAEDKA